MKKPDLLKVTKTIRVALTKRSPEILTGIGIAGMLTTTAMAVRATPKALQIYEEEVHRRNLDAVRGEPVIIKRTDVIKWTWKCYIPSCVVGGLSTVCLIGASSVNSKRNTVLATAYTLSESVLKDYQEKVIETIGEKKEQGIRDAIAKDRIDNNPVDNQTVIITNKGETLCYDMISGRYFKTDIDRIKKAEIELSRIMLDNRYVALNDFYYEIGLAGIGIGDDLGWNIDDSRIDLYFTSQLTPDGEPCLVINYRVQPREGYYKLC